MNIVQPYAKILEPHLLGGSLRRIEYAARISHRSEDLQTDMSWERFIKAVVVDHGDWSVVEHVSVSVEFLVDRGITHEIVRHRLASYTQESTRFVNYAKKMPPSFIYPTNGPIGIYCPKHDEHTVFAFTHPGCLYSNDWLWAIATCEKQYKGLLASGWRPQEARSVLPNALAAKLLMTANLRSWRHFLLMRTTKETHPQMKQVTIPLLAEFKSLVPILFDDIEPGARQVDNISKGR